MDRTLKNHFPAASVNLETFDTIKALDDIEDFYFLDLAGLDKNLFGLASPKKVIECYLNLSA